MPRRASFHQSAHEIQKVFVTGRVPSWCFADEDFNRLIVRAIRGQMYNPSVGQRTLLLWSVRLHSTFGDDSPGVLTDLSDSDTG